MDAVVCWHSVSDGKRNRPGAVFWRVATQCARFVHARQAAENGAHLVTGLAFAYRGTSVTTAPASARRLPLLRSAAGAIRVSRAWCENGAQHMPYRASHNAAISHISSLPSIIYRRALYARSARAISAYAARRAYSVAMLPHLRHTSRIIAAAIAQQHSIMENKQRGIS